MFDFFLALFGIPYYTHKYLKERRTHTENQRILNGTIKWNEKRFEELAPTKEELERAKVLAFYKTEKGIEEVRDALIRIFGENYNERIKEAYKNCVKMTEYSPMIGNFSFWVLQLLLAKNGKLDPRMKHKYYSLGSGHFTMINIGYCREIERYLHEAGHTEMKLGCPLSINDIKTVKYSEVLFTMHWLCPGAWGNRHRLW